MVKNLPVMQETRVWSLGWEDPLEKEMQPIPAFLPGEFHEQGSLAGYSPWGCKELDMTEGLKTLWLFTWDLLTMWLRASRLISLRTKKISWFFFFTVITVSTVDKGLGSLVPRNILCDFEIMPWTQTYRLWFMKIPSFSWNGACALVDFSAAASSWHHSLRVAPLSAHT